MPILQPFGPNLWLADGPVIKAALGFAYPTRMAVIRLTCGGLFVWSPVALSQHLRLELAAIGPVRYLIAPNSLHHTYLRDWAACYPDADVFGAAGLKDKRPDIADLHQLCDAAPSGWRAQIDQVSIPGNLITTEVVFFHRQSATVLFTDLLQQFPEHWFTGWRYLMARLDRLVEPQPTVPIKFRIAFHDRRAARAAIRRVLGWPAKAVVMAHGSPVSTDGQAFLARAFHWLVPSRL
jgi:hypothetical protein